MFADAGVISLFHRGRRLDDVAITITSGDTGPADVQEETAAAGNRRIFLAAHPSRNKDGGREGRRARAGKDHVGGPPAFSRLTPLPEATSFDHGVGLLSHAGEDVLVSLLANRRALNAQRVLLQGHGPVSYTHLTLPTTPYV